MEASGFPDDDDNNNEDHSQEDAAVAENQEAAEGGNPEEEKKDNELRGGAPEESKGPQMGTKAASEEKVFDQVIKVPPKTKLKGVRKAILEDLGV